jgi:glycosyltransferase involved in cell wall biosynthesis
MGPDRDRKHRILFIEHAVGIGGGQLGVLDLLKELDTGRFEPVVTCVAEGELARRFRSLGVQVEILDIRRVLRRNPVHTLARMRDLSRLIQSHGVDLIHVNAMKALLFCGLIARLHGVPVIWHCHVPSDFRGLFDPAGSAIARTIIANSESVMGRFSGSWIARGKARLMYEAIDFSGLQPDRSGVKVRRELGIEDHATVIGTVGRLVEEKGIEYALAAMPGIIDGKPDTALLIVGEGVGPDCQYSRRLKAMASDLGISRHVRFAGFRSDVGECFGAMDIVLMPSLREGFGRTVAEAMAMGKPVIASRVGGIPEIIDDGTTGILVPPEDSMSIAAAVRALTEDPERALRMGKAGRLSVLRRFDVKILARTVEGIYSDILE